MKTTKIIFAIFCLALTINAIFKFNPNENNFDPLDNANIGTKNNRPSGDENTYNPADTQRGFYEEAKRSNIRGIGKYVIGGFGDILQLASPLVGNNIEEGNFLSKSLQTKGEIFAFGNENFTSPEYREQVNSNFWSLNTLTYSDAWSNPIAELFPIIVIVFFGIIIFKSLR